MDETAEFIGGAIDGRTVTVRESSPHVIRLPVMAPVKAVRDSDDEMLERVTLEVDDYELIGRNDRGHLRYMKRR